MKWLHINLKRIVVFPRGFFSGSSSLCSFLFLSKINCWKSNIYIKTVNDVFPISVFFFFSIFRSLFSSHFFFNILKKSFTYDYLQLTALLSFLFVDCLFAIENFPDVFIAFHFLFFSCQQSIWSYFLRMKNPSINLFAFTSSHSYFMAYISNDA